MKSKCLVIFVLTIFSISTALAQGQSNCEKSVRLAKQMITHGLYEYYDSAKDYSPSGESYCQVAIYVVESSTMTDDGRCAMTLKEYFFSDSGTGPILTVTPTLRKVLSLRFRSCPNHLPLSDFVTAGAGLSFRTMSMVIGAIELLRKEQNALGAKQLVAIYSGRFSGELLAHLCEDERNCVGVYLRLDDDGNILGFELAEVM